MLWYAGCVEAACAQAVAQVQGVAQKSRIWAELQQWHPQLTASQCKALNKLYDSGPAGLAGGMNREKYTAIALVSPATAYRELTARTELGVHENAGQGRGTRYGLTTMT